MNKVKFLWGSILYWYSQKERDAYLQGIQMGWWLYEHKDEITSEDLKNRYGVSAEGK